MANKMPTTKYLLIFSYLSIILGLFLALFFIFFNTAQTRILAMSIILVFCSLLLAGILRMLANIGQMIFDIKRCLKSTEQNINNINSFFEQIARHLDLKK
jgi:hypothetical protein